MTHTIFRPKPGVLAQSLGDEVVLLDANNGVYFSLNPTGARAWQMLSEGQPVDAILDALESEFDVTRQVLAPDIQKLLDELQQNKLIEPQA